MVKFVRILFEAAKTGTVTVLYPRAKPLVTESFRGAIRIDPAKCVGCGACVRVCPPKALTLTVEGEVATLRYFVGRCIFCGMCADVCPERAITVTKEFELASRELYDLFTDVEHTVRRCARCSKPFTTVKLFNKVGTEIPEVPPDVLELCPECRRRETLARNLRAGGGEGG